MSCNTLLDEYTIAKDARDVVWRITRLGHSLQHARDTLAKADEALAKLASELDDCLDKAGVEPGPVTISARSIFCYSDRGGSNPYIVGGCRDFSRGGPAFDASATLTGPWWQGDAPATAISPGQELRAINLGPYLKLIPPDLVAELFKGQITQKPFWNTDGKAEKIPPRAELKLIWLVMDYANDDTLGGVRDVVISSLDSNFQDYMHFLKVNGLTEPPREVPVSKLDLRLAALDGSHEIVGNGDYFDVSFVIRRG